MARFNNFMDASLHPPALDHQPPDEAGCPLSWAMLDTRAYIADRRNATTAYGRTSTGVEFQVTFCTAPPPVVSYFCVWCPEEPDLDRLYAEPRIVTAEADIVALRVAFCSPNCRYAPQSEIFVYQAGDPSLHRVGYTGIHLYFNIGILHQPDRNGNNKKIDDPFYLIGLEPSERPWEFGVNLYDSNDDCGPWSSYVVRLGQQYQHSKFRHSASKVVMIGEEDLMGFVDLWRGILVFDVLSRTRLYHIAFPEPLVKVNQQRHPDDPTMSRDIAAVQGGIKVFDCSRCPASGHWKASVWSRKATSREEHWKMEHTLEICDDLVDSTTTLHLELLPVLDVDGVPRRTLEGLHITYPKLSLNDDDDDIVYFMAKVNPRDENAWVLAVDMRTKKLQDVSVFRAKISSGAASPYVHSTVMTSRITKYFSRP